MIKRIISISLVLVFSLSLFLIPVSATGTSDGSMWLTNVLDYTSVTESGNRLVFVGSTDVEIELPFVTNVNYVDMVLYSSTGEPSVTWVAGSGTTDLTVEFIRVGVYRVYGVVANRQSSKMNFTFSVDNTSSTTHIAIFQLNIGRQQMSSVATVGTLNLSYPSVSSITMDSPTLAASLVVPNVSSSSKYVDFGGYININDWRKFDSIDVFLNVDSTTINSISASIGDTIVPYEMQFIDGTVPEFDSSIGDSTSSISVLRYVRITLDLTGVKRTENSSLVINYSGIYDAYQTATLTLYRVTGYVFATAPDASVFWLRNLWTAVSDGFDRIAELLNPDSTVVDESINQADQAISDIHDMEQQYAADLDSSVITSEVSKVENYGNALVFCGSVLSRTFTQLQGYQIIYILPICVGLFLFVASRTRLIHVPRQHSAPKANDTQVLDNKEG